ncbi:MAG: hypothetical protein IKV10_03015 [Alphaproteobacteria bacterium]|nr:hypothetical protein [Alphaproteobacteria bacterium]
MQTTKELKTFERKNGTVVLQTTGAQYVITTAQRVRMDLVWTTKTVREDIHEALAKFEEHKACILSHGHCNGDDSRFR